MSKSKLALYVGIAILGVAFLVCFVAPLFVAMGRDMWQYALS